MKKACLCVGALVAMPFVDSAPAAQAARGPSDITYGIVRDSRSGMPLPRVRVEPVNESRSLPVLTDAQGRFIVPSPRIKIRVSKAGYSPRTLDSAQLTEAGFIVRLAPGAAITGRVNTASGVPIPHAIVTARLMRSSDVPESEQSIVESDDRGEYRIGGLAEGSYVVELLVAPQSQRPSSGGPMLLRPRTDRAGATARVIATVDLRVGEEVDVGDMILEEPSSADGCAGSIVGAGDSRGQATVKGKVLAASGGPVSCAVVRLARVGGRALVAETDKNGQFEFASVDDGVYTLDVSRIGYVGLRYGQQAATDPGRRITVRKGRTVRPITIRLPKGGVIEGVVRNEYGEPLSGVSVRALQRRRSGELTVAVNAPNVTERMTDDLGRFRVFGLLPGAYYIKASTDSDLRNSASDTLPGHAPTYFPGTTEIGFASALRIADDTEVTGLTVVLAEARTFSISGTALTASGQPATSVTLFESQRVSQIMTEPRTTSVTAAGSFVFTNVVPGSYTLQAIARPESGPSVRSESFEFAMEYVTVEQSEPAPVAIRTRRGAVAEGRVVMEDGGVAPPIRVLLLPSDFDHSPAMGTGGGGAMSSGDGRFNVTGVFGPRRFTFASIPAGSYVKAVTVDGADATKTPFDFGSGGRVYSGIEVVLATSAAAVTGTVASDRGEGVEGCSVLLFSVDRQDWYRGSQQVKVVQSDDSGTYGFSGLPPGVYWIVALDHLDDWSDPDVLQAIAASRTVRRVMLRPSEISTVDLRLTR